MRHQKILDSLDNTPTQPSKLREKNCVKTTDESRGTYNTKSQIEL